MVGRIPAAAWVAARRFVGEASTSAVTRVAITAGLRLGTRLTGVDMSRPARAILA